MAEQRTVNVGVVGAGHAGLAAALDLKQAGARVEIFERTRLLGGRATSFVIDDVEVDNGQHVFLACCTEFIEFARRVGMDDRLHLQERFDALVLARDGRSGRLRAGSLPAPLHLLTSFARFPYLSLGAKFRIGRALLSALRSQTPEGSFEAWLERQNQGAEERAAFWDPFFIPALNAPFEAVSCADAMVVLKTAFLQDAGAARFGFSTVPLAHFAAAAAQRLDAVHLSTAVVGIACDPDGVTLRLLDGGAPRFDAVVLAVPPRVLEKILGDASGYGVHGLDAFEPYPIVDVHLWHGAGRLDFDFAAALESPLQWIFEKEPGYLCCSFSAADEYVRMPSADLQALAWKEVRTFVPALRDAELIRSSVTRNPEATYLPRIGASRPVQRTSQPRVAIAGAWTETGWPDTMESAVRSGREAAAVILSEASLRAETKNPLEPLPSSVSA